MPSSQVTALGKCTQPLSAAPLASEHVSSVHTLSSPHSGAIPWHLACKQTSLVLQAWPSLQGTPSASSWTQPFCKSHESAEHGLPSSQFAAPPATHLPALQLSPVVQAFASSQVPLTLP